MKFDHWVKCNGVWYKAGTEVPASSSVETKTEEKEQQLYTKTEINRMSKNELVELAKTASIDHEGQSGTKLKAMLIEHFGL